MSKAQPARVQTASPNTGRDNVRIDARKYAAVRQAILKAVPAKGAGLPFRELAKAVKSRLPGGALPGGGSISWYTVVVKLDMEVRGELVRVPDVKPQRLLRRTAKK